MNKTAKKESADTGFTLVYADSFILQTPDRRPRIKCTPFLPHQALPARRFKRVRSAGAGILCMLADRMCRETEKPRIPR